jgi:hypothetical protein
MKPYTNLKFSITILFFFSFNHLAFCTDLLDNVTAKTQLINDLKDVYRAYDINHKIADQKELINVYADAGGDVKKMLVNYVNVCNGLKQVHFFNDTLYKYVQHYLNSTIQNYNIAITSGINSVTFKKNYKAYLKGSDKYFSYVANAYRMERFVSMSEKQYWQLNDKKNYIKSTNYAAYEKLKVKDLKAGLALLERTSSQAVNFQEFSIYQIEIADQYVKHHDKLGDNSNELAVGKYKALLDKNKYSVYLFESWLKWRAVTQQYNGLSKMSEIPNDQYDKVRQQAALTILKTASANTKDKMAINEFLQIATHDIVRRFGAYEFGNQNTLEYREIFDDTK